jgi:hypothetical protein
VARQRRHTEPLKTLRGTLTDYAEIDRFLLDGEFKGRSWIFERSQAVPLLSSYDDHDIRALHRVMFGDLLEWVGEFRTDERGPGGQVFIPWYHVAVAVRTFTDNLGAWVAALSPDPVLEELAGVMRAPITSFRESTRSEKPTAAPVGCWIFTCYGSRSASRKIRSPPPRRSSRFRPPQKRTRTTRAYGKPTERLRNYYCERLAAVFEAG